MLLVKILSLLVCRLVDQDTCPYNGSRREMCTVCHKQRFKEAGLTKFSKIRIDLRLLQVNSKLPKPRNT